ncbi:MAG: hypothetical protein BWY70_00982 [Bacteroidetes bacterium ADurb.Bin408]|nr:MAG: hypothetical protein BWY70_00982 [Bacteroidetes bacterium ADurb.Bin408]
MLFGPVIGQGFLCIKEIKLPYSFGQGTKFELGEQFFECFAVNTAIAEISLMECYRGFGTYCTQFFRQQGLVGIGHDIFAHPGVTHLCCIFNKIFDRTELFNEFFCPYFAYTGYAGNIVGSIAPQPDKVNKLRRALNFKLAAYFCHTPFFVGKRPLGWFINKNIFVYQLSEILIGCYHIYGIAQLFGLQGQSADNIIRFIAFVTYNRDVKTFDNFFYIGNGQRQILGHGFALGFIRFILNMSECRGRQIESHSNMRRFFVF